MPNDEPNGSQGAEPIPVILKGRASATAHTTATLTPMLYLSYYHLQAAAIFARQAGAIKEPMEYVAHTAYVIGVVCECANFLEALINELFHMAKKVPKDPGFANLQDRVVAIGAEWGKPKEQKKGNVAWLPIIRKYKHFTKLAGKTRLSNAKGNNWSHVDHLVDLRNYLVHHAPTVLSADADGHWIPARSMGRFFAQDEFLNTKLEMQQAAFPLNVLSEPLAQWSIYITCRFVKGFLDHVGVQYRDVDFLIKMRDEFGDS